MPEEFSAYTAEWLRLHPGWEHRLWNLDNLDFPLRRRELIPQCKSYSQMSDLLRFEVLYRYGGVYIDTDFQPFKCIEPLLDGVSTFLCSEDGETLTASIVGSEPAAPLLLRLVDGLPEKIGMEAPNIETGPTYVTRVVLTEGVHNDLTIFPTSYFFPYNMYELHRRNEDFPDAYAAHRYAHSWTWTTKRTLAQRIGRRLGKIARAAMGRD
jgi:mannosyltransferase OCH1-like enzyme